jgi:acetyl esterase
VHVVSTEANGVPVRLYGVPSTAALLYFHGGRFISGDLESHDLYCRELASLSGCYVCAVDYRLAPEHPYPAALEDAVKAARWLDEKVDRMAVGGDSAGGGLAAALAISGEAPPVVWQMLLYPMLDATSSQPVPEGPWPNAADMQRGWTAYADTERHNPLVSPLLAPDPSLFPPTFLLTAEVDPLRDENLAFAARLRQAGVALEHHDYPEMVHGFALMTTVFASAREALATTAQALHIALAGR